MIILIIAYPETYQIPTGHFIYRVIINSCNAFLEVRSGFLLFAQRVKCNKKLLPVALKFGKDLDVLSKIVKGSCTDVPDPRLLLLDDAITDSVRLLLGLSG